jgi:WD40 repeat protein
MKALCILALLVQDVNAQALVADFPSRGSSAVAIDSAGTRVTYLVGFKSMHQVDVPTGRDIQAFDFRARNSLGNFSNVVVDPGGAWAAGAGNGNLVMVEAATGALQRVLKSPGSDFLELVSSPTGDRIAGMGQGFGGIVIWDVASGREVRRIVSEPRGGSYALAWSPRGEVLAQGGARWPAAEVVLWDASRGTELRRLEHGLAPIHALAFSPDGKLLVARERTGTLIAWRVASGRVAWSLQPDSTMGANIGFLPGGRFLVVGGGVPGGRVSVFDATNGRKRTEWAAYSSTEGVLDLACAKNRPRVVTTGTRGTIRVWDLAEFLAGKNRR